MLVWVATSAMPIGNAAWAAGVPVTYGDFGPNQSFSTTLVPWCVTGATNTACTTVHQRLVAAPITPNADFALTQVQLAISFLPFGGPGNGPGTNGAIVKLVDSAGGAPGSNTLESWSPANLPAVTAFPPPSAPAVVTLNSVGSPILHANTQYWLVAEGLAADTIDVWWENNQGLATGTLTSIDGGSWVPLGVLPAFALTGTLLGTVTYGDLGLNGSFNTTSGGWCVSGNITTACGPPTLRWIAAAFTPNADFTLTQIQLALNYNTGLNSGIVKLVNSVNGVPGSLELESWSNLFLPSVHSPQLFTLNSVAKPALHAFTQYWLVAEASDPTTLDFWWVNNQNLSGGMTSLNGGLTWSSLGPGDTLPAFAVTGTLSVSAYGSLNPATSQPPNCGGADPVNCANGNLTESMLDLVVAGRGRVLAWGRSYNSQAAAAASTAGSMGFGWSSTYTESLSIDPSGSATITQGNGSTVAFLPSGGGVFVAPPFVTATLVKNIDGSYTFTLKNGQADVFDSSGRLIKQTDRHGYVTTLTYSGGKLVSITDPANRMLAVITSGGKVTSVQDPMGRRVSYGYDAGGNLIMVTDVAGNVTRYAYDSQHQITAITDRRGNTSHITYDSAYRVVKEVSAQGRTIAFSYGGTPANPTTLITDGNGKQVLETFSQGSVQSITRGYGTGAARTWNFTYDPATLARTGITDPAGNIWHATYDGLGNLLSQTDPLGRTTHFTYNALNEPVSGTDASGVTTLFTYDAHGTLLTVGRAGATVTYNHADPAHPADVTSQTDPTGRTWTFTYDAYGNQLTKTDSAGNTTHGGYNLDGWLLSTRSPLNETTTYHRDDYGAVNALTDPLGAVTTYTYDPNHNLVAVTTPDHHTATVVYDPDNLPLTYLRADGSVLHNGYDGAGNLISQTDPLGHVTHYAYDALEREVGATDPLGRIVAFTYDPASRLGTRTDPQVTQTFTYDAAGELTQIVYNDGTPTVTFQYDSLGRRKQMNDSTGTTTWQYDSLGRLMSTTDGFGKHVGYGYDLAGRLLTLTYPAGGTVSRTYDNVGRMASVKDWSGATTTFAYDQDSRLVKRTYPNSIATQFAYDAASRLTGMADPLVNLQYQRDPMGYVQSADNDSVPGGNDFYSYDAVGRLSSHNGSDVDFDAASQLIRLGDLTMSYDAAGQLTSARRGDEDEGGTSFNYDARGNRLKVSGHWPANYQYDGASRLVGIAGVAGYTYTGDGLRVKKTVGAKTQIFAWDRAEGLPLVLDDGINQYIYGPGGLPLEQVDAHGNKLFFHQDQLGSTRALSDPHGNAVAKVSYDPFGTPDGSLTATPLGFASQYTDSESGLIFMRARYYEPATGQFLSRDPLVGQTRQPYAYAVGNPVNAADPSGLLSFDVWGNPIGGFNGSLGNGQSISPWGTIIGPTGLPIGGSSSLPGGQIISAWGTVIGPNGLPTAGTWSLGNGQTLTTWGIIVGPTGLPVTGQGLAAWISAGGGCPTGFPTPGSGSSGDGGGAVWFDLGQNGVAVGPPIPGGVVAGGFDLSEMKKAGVVDGLTGTGWYIGALLIAIGNLAGLVLPRLSRGRLRRLQAYTASADGNDAISKSSPMALSSYWTSAWRGLSPGRRGAVQNMPERLRREAIAVLQPASVAAEPANRPWARKAG